MTNHFKNQFGPWAVVTGSSDGIGKRLAGELAKKGLNIVLVARRKEMLESLAEELKKLYQVQVKVIAIDLSRAGSVIELFNNIKNIDVGLLVAATGFGTSGSLIDSNIESELNMIQVNCSSVVEQCFYFGKMFSEKRRGGIILISSLVAFQGVPRAANYSATKAFIQNLAEGLHFELKPFGVSVLASAPGPVDSGFAKRANMIMGRAAKPEDIAEATVSALGHSITVRPGFLSKLLGWSLLTMPRKQRVLAMQKIMNGMTSHQSKAGKS